MVHTVLLSAYGLFSSEVVNLTLVHGLLGFVTSLVFFRRFLPLLSILRSELFPGFGHQLGDLSSLCNKEEIQGKGR